MRLSTQLSTSLLVFLILVFAGSFVINVKLTREYVNEQLATHAQDTATSLGLSITPYLSEDNGIAVAETMVNAIFDRGFYQYITITDMEGNLLIEKRNPTTVDTVPSWFTDIVEITPPVEKTELNDGWTMAGELAVQSHPRLANETLWESVKQSAFMFFAAFVFAYIALLFIITAITKPLRIVVNKIEDIQNQKFSHINYKPFTKELSFITQAVNRLSSSVEAMFKELTQKAEQYRIQAYEDSLTGTQNRSAFSRHMTALLSKTATSDEGYVILIRLAQLNAINITLGAQEGDNYVISVANELKSFTSSIQETAFLFRVSGADFVLVTEAMTKQDCEARLQELSTSLSHCNPIKDGSKAVWIGAAQFNDEQSFSEIMENADSALMAATKQANGWQFASELSHIHSNTAWKERLNQILEQQYADIVIQPVMNIEKNAPSYYEAFARFKEKSSGNAIPMSQLIPASERLNLIPEVDKLVVTLVLNKLAQNKRNVAINIANASLANAAFRQWLLTLLNQNTALCTQLVFELEDSALIHHKDDAISFCKSLVNLGCKITIEHFGDNLASLAGLRAIQPHFVKISGKLTKDIHADKDSQLFVTSLLSIARGLNINVIAELVENEAESVALSRLDVAYQQGFYFAKPALWQY
ncbi:GGDEF domain-containing protein [Alteromonas sp. KUL150]|uniref:bifunctional diguanylate cyclase/phosphodiesterase n=1 Tax=Alteromonas sp. KUL150 TaxID=2480805 RepID=UPI0012E414EB|nr:EAL domain-containing protein [Alteromonas sp. KUL150]GFD84047.1 GGDEF domain-containing protein [Alteromonas sp. KUL150]